MPSEQPRPRLLDAFTSSRIAVMLLLGFASGLPLALSTGSLQAWLTVSGVDIKTIGFFALAGLPYTFKFVWAPLVDRFEPPWAGRRRGWLMLTQLALAGACLVMAQLDPATQIDLMGAVAVAIAFLSATQDVVFDAYRSDLLLERERGAGAAVLTAKELSVSERALLVSNVGLAESAFKDMSKNLHKAEVPSPDPPCQRSSR